MKRNIIVIIFILLVKFSYAQQQLLSFDEHNKYIFYQVNDVPGIAVDSLYARGLIFVKSLTPKIKLKTGVKETDISGEGKFIIYNSTSVLKHESGEIDYVFNMEFKDQKYRFWLTDFSFTPYERDRYNNYVPKVGIEIPLETAASKLDKKEVETHLDETGAFCKQFGERLKIYLQNAPKKEENTKKVVTDKW
jgi:Domain of unknown function (DUF4468) with TBP-like fold